MCVYNVIVYVYVAPFPRSVYNVIVYVCTISKVCV